MKGKTRIIQIGMEDETPIPTLIAIKAISVAVSKPNPKRTPIGYICQGSLDDFE